MAWQFDRPDLGEGVVQVFRRESSVYESARFPLFGLDNNALYTIRDIDSPNTVEMTGAELADRGLAVELSDCPKAATFVYTRSRKTSE
jgi:alpha-galactosidase